MTLLILIVAIATLVVVALTPVWARRAQTQAVTSPSGPPATARGPATDIARALGSWLEAAGVEPAPDNVIVHAQGDGTAIVFGSDHAVDGIGETLERLPRQLTTMAVGSNAVIQGIITGGEMSGRLVRLSQQTVEAMKTGKKLVDANGNILGVIQNGKGKFKHVVRFKDMGNLQALSGATGALSAMAVQAQLQRIEDAIAALDTKVSFLVDEVFIDARATTLALDQVIGVNYRIARQAGELTPATWEPVSQLALPLAVHHNKTLLRLDKLGRELQGIGRGTKDRKDTLKHLLEDERLLDWLELSLEATRLRSGQDAMRLWHAITTNDQAAPTMARILRTEMAERHQLLLDVHRQLVREVEQMPEVKAWRKLNPLRYNKLEKLVDRTSPKMAEVTAALNPLALPAPAVDPETEAVMQPATAALGS